MKRKNKLKRLSIKSFVTTKIAQRMMKNLAAGYHPECPTDGGPETMDDSDICKQLVTTPGTGCEILM